MKPQTVINILKLHRQTGSLQETINWLFSSPTKMVIYPDYIKYIVSNDGNKYFMSRYIDAIRQVQEDYQFDDIRKTDIVIDIGACIGSFSIPASSKAKHVYAIEPITAEMIRANVQLNSIENINVIETALGDGSVQVIKCLGQSKTVKTQTLAEIKQMCGGCDFLKVDCEGAEWNIPPEELEGIRRIEMEVHKVGHPLHLMEDRLRLVGFELETVPQPEGTIGLWVIHARRSNGLHNKQDEN